MFIQKEMEKRTIRFALALEILTLHPQVFKYQNRLFSTFHVISWALG